MNMYKVTVRYAMPLTYSYLLLNTLTGVRLEFCNQSRTLAIRDARAYWHLRDGEVISAMRHKQ